MITQLVFFLAVAIFIALLLRRVGLSTGGSNQLANRVRILLIGFGAVVSRLLVSIFQRIRATRLPRPDRSQRPSTQQTINTPTSPPSNQFWAEDQISQHNELLTHFEEGDSLMKAGKYEEAEKFFLMAATHNPKESRVYAKLGLIYLHTKSYNDAIEALKVAVKLDKYNPSRHYNLALAYSGNKDSQRAIASIREAISLDPGTSKYRQFLEELLNKK